MTRRHQFVKFKLRSKRMEELSRKITYPSKMRIEFTINREKKKRTIGTWLEKRRILVSSRVPLLPLSLPISTGITLTRRDLDSKKEEEKKTSKGLACVRT